VINYREESIVERLKEITSGKKVRVVYDSVGKTPGKRRWTACSVVG
jgi:NADPH:quinone reductase-like Zn-dependent oxidoreductase